MTVLVGYLLLFIAVGVGFILAHLVAGKLIRPAKPSPEKLTIYECGEPTIGSSWVQFDLRFYVIALLFVIFDVEVAFFFPWAVVFGKANDLSRGNLTEEQRIETTLQLAPVVQARRDELVRGGHEAEVERLDEQVKENALQNADAAHQMALIAFIDILVFFGVLLVGFAYLWKRGDLAWVRSREAQELGEGGAESEPMPAGQGELVGAGRS